MFVIFKNNRRFVSMENADKNMFDEINAVCDKYNAPRIGTPAFEELCELVRSGKMKEDDNLVSVEIAKIPTTGLKKFIDITGVTCTKLKEACLYGRGFVNIKESQANLLGLI